MGIEDTIRNAQAAQLRHAAVLVAVPANPSNQDLLNAYNAVHDIVQPYTVTELARLGFSLPTSMDGTNPEHAVFLRTRDDMIDSMNRYQAIINNRGLVNQIKRAPSVGSLAVESGTKLLSGAGEFFQKLADGVKGLFQGVGKGAEGAGAAVPVVIAAGVVLLFLYLRRK